MSSSVYFPNAEFPAPGFLGGDRWELSQLAPITVFFGKNGSGKSILLRSWRDTNPDISHYVVPERTGEINFEPGLLKSEIDSRNREDASRGNFTTDYRRRIVARIQAYFLSRGDTRATALVGDPSELERILTQLLPDFTVTLRGTKDPPYILTRLHDNTDVKSVEAISSGEAQLFTLGVDILTMAAIWDMTDAESRLLLVDEPDAHIHPDLQVRFADFLVQAARRYKLQVAVATHSTTMLSAIGQFAEEDAAVIYVKRAVKQFRARRFTSELIALSACLGGHALMGPLFAQPLLLVEGDDDYRIWSQVPRHHRASFAVVPCGGDQIRKYQRHLVACNEIPSALVKPSM